MITESLGDRMKTYENVTRNYLMKRTPVVVRLDGKAFHTYTRSCSKPYDYNLHIVRRNTLFELCNTIPGVCIGYSQSDEISLILKDWTTHQTEAWFNNNIQKIASVTASTCTMMWNEHAKNNLLSSRAVFDARVFNVPMNEVCNYLIWRQKDWERNSVQMLAQKYYSHKQIQGISNRELITKIEQEHNIVWGNLDTWKKQGEVFVKDCNTIDQSFLFTDPYNKETIQRVLEYTEN